MNYVETIHSLFAILHDCNMGDTDQRQPWQIAGDCIQRGGAYGHVRNAIVALAGEAIVEDWAHTGSVDITLADRLHLAAGHTEPAGEYPAAEHAAAEGLARLTRRVKLALDAREEALTESLDEHETNAAEAVQMLSGTAHTAATTPLDKIRYYSPVAAARAKHLHEAVQEMEAVRWRLKEVQGLRESILTAPHHFPV